VPELNHLLDLYNEELYAIGPKVLVVLEKEWSATADEERSLLDKILHSVKRSRSSVRIISRPSFQLSDITAYQPSHVIAFGARLQGKSTTYEVIEDGGIALIQADDLVSLDDKKKKALWLGLQEMFGLRA
jgi:dephospho-CoA kinase